MARTTLQQIADRVGVTKATVSMALRKHPRISESRRLEIEAAAEEMGYRPDPGLARVAAQRWQGKAHSGNGIAYFHRYRDAAALENCYRTNGIMARAKELGYLVTDFPIHSSKEIPAAARRCWAMGIQAVIWNLPQSLDYGFDSFPWKNVVAVALGNNEENLRLKTVSEECFKNCEMVCEQLLARAYRRPALVVNEASTDQRIRLIEGAWYASLTGRPGIECLPVLRTSYPVDTRAYLRWVQKVRPDVIVGSNDSFYYFLRHGSDPEFGGIDFVSLHLWPHLGAISGIHPRLDRQGRTAVDTLHVNYLNSDYGLEHEVYFVSIHGRWHEGETLLRKRH